MSKPVFEDLFSFGNVRRNRLSYFLYSLALFALMVALVFLSIGYLGAVNPSMFSLEAPTPQDPNGLGALVLLGALMIPIAISSWAVSAQRCRDFGWSGWAVLLTMVPYVGFIFAIALLFIPGTDGENRYGPNPVG